MDGSVETAVPIRRMVRQAVPEALRDEVVVVSRTGRLAPGYDGIDLRDVFALVVGAAGARGETSMVLVDTDERGVLRVHDDGRALRGDARATVGIERALRRFGLQARTRPSDRLCGRMVVLTPLG